MPRLCLVSALIYVRVDVIVHVFIFFCLDMAGVVAYETMGSKGVTPLALLILGAIQLRVPWVVPKALFA